MTDIRSGFRTAPVNFFQTFVSCLRILREEESPRSWEEYRELLALVNEEGNDPPLSTRMRVSEEEDIISREGVILTEVAEEGGYIHRAAGY